MQLTIINKITLGFGLFGCLLLLTSILSYFGLSGIKDSAQDVVEQKMPVQTSMVKVKTEILSLSVITANGYHVENREELVANKETFDTLSSAFSDDLSRLNSLMPNNAVASNAVDVSLAYVNSSNDMYTAINERMNIEKALAAQLEKVLMTADEASALMLDLSYLEGNNPSIETLIGAGTAIDNKLLTMNDSFIELAETDNATQSASIIEDLEYQLSNLQVDKDYVNRLATGVDDGGTIASFNEQYDLLMEAVNGTNGLIALQRQKLSEVDKAAKAQKEAKEALETALADINTLFDAVQKQSLDGQNAILESVQANLVRNIVVAALGLVAAIFLAVIVTRSISKPLGRINKGLSQLSKGDLSTKLPQEGNDEFSALSAKVNSLTDSLRELVGNILEQEKRLIDITKESVELGNKSLSEVDKQREQVTVTSTNTKHVQEKSRSNLAQINEAMDALRDITKQSTDIGQLVQKSSQQVGNQAKQAESSAQIINRLDDNSRNIGSILDVIKTIAEQTNLLALNAAIEAARAGEQGRGFAVVADEVRTLANRTHDSTEEIEQMIGNLQKDAAQAVKAINAGREQAQEGVEITQQVSQQVESIREIIERLSDINEHIVADTEQQDVLLGDVAKSLNRIVALADSSAQSTRQSNESTMLLDAQTESLRKAVERFHL
ncbi:MAG TPA: methyl-accepting chemotaxis protein [Alteromonas macleodii]|uniref:Methyl-accepting chemotaxis (MCP) signaling domain protein n=2 Tax=cellular organisms TaxID=131567 RepID=A0AB36FR07_ALTMA|nr:methyl-accepting chemotaxis protein [Alteromonas macleodii]OES30785.1 methyl-accepting chemotaxis (MCP) signaling domain protein [Alteromonas macleodii]OES31148.1 methyl-accepting chemotaxis (MCP) signaling domain protein [Alteromonas macleodii]OES31724.1 methyl-accepting chemotaxis (MCP) signaling domain protein [Alteromonas macleodii]OES40997.1 methyl-accepting chemotaxis (MCP) signaling domain protein [Alteromonas macleodii]HAD89584.1 methyl-accepting chemotaxis protein [Alteromonas macl|tara:strand:+ start:2922 stop:4928 length:2007 start_codon:yes stop_codon:yes gene_type:complete